MPYTEFCCRLGGSNLNAGTLDGSSTEVSTTPFATYTGGNWNPTAGVYTVVGGDPVADGVASGHWVGLAHDSSTSCASGIYRITSVTTSTIVVNLATSGQLFVPSGNSITCRVGGAWSGPSGVGNTVAGAFPFGVVHTRTKNSRGYYPRINFKNNQDYIFSTVGVTHAIAGPIRFQGYQDTYGDGSRCTFRHVLPLTGNGLALLTVTSLAGVASIVDMNFLGGGTASANILLTLNGTAQLARNILCSGSRGGGLSLGATNSTAENIEIVHCNRNNSTNHPGLTLGSTNAMIKNVYIHHCSGSNTDGIRASDATFNLDGVICAFNGRDGINLPYTANVINRLYDVDCYGNARHGINASGNTSTELLACSLYVDNANIAKNSGMGIFLGGSGILNAIINNVAFGSGTEANTLGTITPNYESGAVVLSNIYTYPLDTQIYLDPDNNNFTLRNLDILQQTYVFSPYSSTSGSFYRGAAPPLQLTDEQIASGVWTYPNRTTT